MIGWIRGKLIEKQPPLIGLEAFGIGYEIEVPLSTLFLLPELEREVLLYTHLVIRDDAHLLYGFFGREDRNLFRLLLKVNGIGPKAGLALLSALSAKELVEALLNGEVKRFIQVPGIGKKTAERLILELSDKLKTEASLLSLNSAHPSAKSTVLYESLRSTLKSTAEMEAESALMSLGFKPIDAEKAVKKVFVAGLSSEELIRSALKVMLV